MPTVTRTEYIQKMAEYQTIAQSDPVIITSDGREETVLLSYDEYCRLTRRRRRPYLIEELPDEDWRAIEEASAALLSD
ncbi:MAG: type II toxin-antitoxin system Phd/YefM family antitoxin [Acetobacteraceae bacterium]|nr:type II toxin-antitoxin system Phd/YefM family antitoxin [Acetobacteraceae bacterium]